MIQSQCMANFLGYNGMKLAARIEDDCRQAVDRAICKRCGSLPGKPGFSGLRAVWAYRVVVQYNHYSMKLLEIDMYSLEYEEE